MGSIALSERTLEKLRELKQQIIAEDAMACKGKTGDCIGDIAFFWNDDRVLEFMMDIVKRQVGGAGYSSYVIGRKKHELSQEERDSLV